MRRVNIMFTIVAKRKLPPLDKRVSNRDRSGRRAMGGPYFVWPTTNNALYHQYTLQLRFYQTVETLQVILKGIQLR